MSEDLILRVEKLKKSYGKFSLQEVSFQLPRGYAMGFVGQNGAGKSTTIKCIMDLVRAESGTIELFGQDARKDPMALRQRVGYVSEEPSFYEDMTVEWTGRFVGTFYENWDDDYWHKLLCRFDVDPAKQVRELSRGMKVKLALSLAMAHRPELLLLDEPTSGLDPVIRGELLQIFREILQDERCSIFFSSHITSDIEQIADYITIIQQGRIIASADKHQLLDQWQVIKADKRLQNQQIDTYLVGKRVGEYSCSALVRDPDGFSRAFRQAFPGASYQAERPTLDELLIRLAHEEVRVG